MAIPKQIARQEKIIAQGVARFVFIYGVFIFGPLFFIIRTLLAIAAGTLSLNFIVLSVIMCAISGAIFGLIIWLFINWQYRNATEIRR
jgi:hypothetical protein